MKSQFNPQQNVFATRHRRWWMVVQLCVVSIFFYQCANYAPPTQNGANNGGSGSLGVTTTTQAAPPITPENIKPPQTEGPSAIEEADIYRVVGDKMFVLHRNKGFLILDIKNAASPHKIAFLPLNGIPAEMFVDKETAYLLMQETVQHEASDLEPRDVVMQSALIAVDIRDLQAPKILQHAGLPGRVMAGSSRRIGTRLYIVVRDPNVASPSWQETTAEAKAALSVVSVDVSDPQRFRITHQLGLKGHSDAPLLLGKRAAFEAAQGTDTSTQSMEALRAQLAVKRLALGAIRPIRFLQHVVTGAEGHLLVSETWLVTATIWTMVTDRMITNTRTGGCLGLGGSQTSVSNTTRLTSFPVQLNFTVVNVLDLRDANGEIKTVSRFRLHGLLPDQTKQHVIKTADGRFVYIGVTMRNQLEITNTTNTGNTTFNPIENAVESALTKVTSRLVNVVASVDISDLAKPVMLDDIFFGKEREAVRATYFDTQRQILYAITATADPDALQGGNVDFAVLRERRERLRIYDPLYTIQISQPASLTILGALDDLNGDMNLFRPIQGGDYLLAVGRDTSATCTGFEASTGRYSRTSVSLVDVRDLKKPRLVQRRCIGVQLGAAIVSSEVNWDLDQAHKQIGLYSEGDTHLISVPVQFEKTEGDRLKSYTAVGLMRWDLRRDDKNKAASEQDVLQELGTFLHPRGRVERTFFMMLDYAQQPRLSLLNFSQDILSVTDLEDLEKPRLAANLELAPVITHAFPLKDRILLRKQTLDSLQTPTPSYQWELRQVVKGIHLEDGPLIETWESSAQEIPMAWGEMLLIDRKNALEVISFSGDKRSASSIQVPKGWGGFDALQKTISRKDGHRVLLTPQGILAVGQSQTSIDSPNPKHRIFFLSLLENNPKRAFVGLSLESEGDHLLSLVALGNGDIAVRLENTDKMMPQYRVGFLRWADQKWYVTPFSKATLPGHVLHRFADGRVLLSLGDAQGVRQVALGRLTEEGVLIEQSLHAPDRTTFTDITAQGEEILLMNSSGHLLLYRHDTGFLQFVRQWQIKGTFSWQFNQWDADLLVLASSTQGTTTERYAAERILTLPLQSTDSFPQASHHAATLWVETQNPNAPRSLHIRLPLRTPWFEPQRLFFAAEHMGILAFGRPRLP